jgi:hypothetical protein
VNRQQLTDEERDALVEQIRALIRGGLDRSGIKKFLKDKHGYEHRGAGVLIKRARNRNLLALKTTEDEALADSIDYHRRKLAESESLSQQEARKILDVSRRLDAIDAKLDAMPDDTAEDDPVYVRLLARKGIAEKQLESARRTRYTAEMWSRESQDRVDRLLGTARPQKQAIALDVTTQPAKDLANLSAEELANMLLARGIVPLASLDAFSAKPVLAIETSKTL